MKKLLCALLAVVCLVSLVSCSTVDGVPQEEYDALKQEYQDLKEKYDALLLSAPETIVTETEGAKYNRGDFEESTVISQLKVTEYTYSSKYSEYAFLTIKNNSDFNLDISVSVKFYNGEELVGAKSASQEAFDRGNEIVLYFMLDEKYTGMEYEISASEEELYECVVSDLSYEATAAKNKEIVSVTNNGEYAAEFVECHALFFKSGEVVWHDSTYFVDNDNELKAGKTATKELTCYEEYDDVKFFFTGRR